MANMPYQYQPVVNVEPPSIDDLNNMAIALEDVLNNRTHLVAVTAQNQLSIVNRPTGFWAGLARLFGRKAKNQKFDNVALFVRGRLVQAQETLLEDSSKEQDAYIAAFTRLNTAYQTFIRKKLSPDLLFDATNPSLMKKQLEVLSNKERSFQSRGEALESQEQALATERAALARLKGAQTQELAESKIAAERDFQEKERKWRQEVLQTPMTKFGEVNSVALLERASAREGGLEDLDVTIMCADNKPVYAHSKYLRLNDYFKASLGPGWSKEPLDFSEYPVGTVQVLLDYLYLGTLQTFEPNDLIYLYQLAHEKDIPALQEVCKKELQRCLCQNNALIYDLMIGYFEQPDRHPVVIDLLFNLLPDFCNDLFVDYPEERERLAKILMENAPAGDKRFEIVISSLMNTADPLQFMINQYKGDAAVVRKIVEDVAKSGYDQAYTFLGTDAYTNNVSSYSKFYELGSRNSLYSLFYHQRSKGVINESSPLFQMNYAPALASLAVISTREKAIQLAERAAEKGSILGCHVFGNHCFYENEKTIASLEQLKKALPYLQKALSWRSTNYARVGVILYQLGEYEKAVEHFKKSNDLWSQYNLALCLEIGRGTEMDLNLARELYKKSAPQGSNKAKEALERFNRSQGEEYIPPASTQILYPAQSVE